MTDYQRIADGRSLTWEEALRLLLDSGPTEQQVTEFMAGEGPRFRRYPDERRTAEAMVAKARPPWVRPLYIQAVAALIDKGKKPTDELVAGELDVDPRTIRQWRHDGLLR